MEKTETYGAASYLKPHPHPRVWQDNHKPQFCLPCNDNILGDWMICGDTLPTPAVAFKINYFHDLAEAAKLRLAESLLVRAPPPCTCSSD